MIYGYVALRRFCAVRYYYYLLLFIIF